jgi:hypothetical protein
VYGVRTSWKRRNEREQARQSSEGATVGDGREGNAGKNRRDFQETIFSRHFAQRVFIAEDQGRHLPLVEQWISEAVFGATGFEEILTGSG